MLFLHPMQGIIRDLDVFATAGMSLALVAAYGIGLALQRRALPAWIAPAIVLAVAVPTLQWLIHFHDSARGLQRVRAFALEQPVRPDDDRARLWDALAYRAFRLQQWDQALEASEQSARYAPHARPLIMLAIARTYTGAYREAEAGYIDLAKRFPDDPLVWVGLGGAALRMGDTLEVRRSLANLNSYAPNSPQARIIRRHLALFPAVWPTRAELGERSEP
jgi:tetratricopeptide (TPR) repeat protein